MTQPAPAATAAPRTAGARIGTCFRKRILPNWDLYPIVSVPVAYIIIFHYVPMYGAQIAFRNFSPIKGIWGSRGSGSSTWCGSPSRSASGASSAIPWD